MKLYTEHALRRTSATLLSNAGGTTTDLKQLGGWKSDKVAQGYVEDSLHNKKRISNIVAETINVEPSTSKIDNEVFPLFEKKKSSINDDSKTDKDCISPQLKRLKLDSLETSSLANNRSTNMFNLDNCTVTIHNY